MTVKLTLEFATLAELTAAVERLGGAPKGKSAQSDKVQPAPGKPTAAEPVADAPAPSPEKTTKKDDDKPLAYKDTKIAEYINKAVDAGRGPDVKKLLIELKAFDPADNTKVKGPFIPAEDLKRAEEMFAALLANKEDLG